MTTPQAGHSLEGRQRKNTAKQCMERHGPAMYTIQCGTKPHVIGRTSRRRYKVWTKSSIRQMRKGISSRETGICSGTETFNSTVYLRSHTKIRSTGWRRALRDEPLACLPRSLHVNPRSVVNHSTALRMLTNTCPSSSSKSYASLVTLHHTQCVCVALPWKYILNQMRGLTAYVHAHRKIQERTDDAGKDRKRNWTLQGVLIMLP